MKEIIRHIGAIIIWTAALIFLFLLAGVFTRCAVWLFMEGWKLDLPKA